jgi:hypothetical protein
MTLGKMREQQLRFLRSVGTPFCALAMMFSGSAYGAPAAVHGCEGLDSIANLVEPVRGFANNAIRIAHIDTEEPAAAPQHLLIFVAAELMGQDCFAVSPALPESGSVSVAGYSSIDFAKAQASYDAQKALLLVVPVSVFDPNDGIGKPAGNIKVRVSRKKGNSVTIEK